MVRKILLSDSYSDLYGDVKQHDNSRFEPTQKRKSFKKDKDSLKEGSSPLRAPTERRVVDPHLEPKDHKPVSVAPALNVAHHCYTVSWTS